MTVISKKEFAALCGMATNKLWTYTDRGHVILLGDGKVDCNDPRNVAFLQKHSAKKTEEPAKTTTSPAVTEENNSYASLDLKKTEAQVDKLTQEVRLLKLKEEKLKGVVVPSELIKPVFLRHNQSILTEVNNEITEFVRLFSKKRSLTIEETAEIKADVVKWFNDVMAKATLASSAEIKNIVNNYSEKRGVGERE
jgi:phage terminase Nu1 subunit (DNA packaging protein)